MAVAFPKFKLAKDFSPSLVQLGRIVKLLWLMTHSTGADVPVPETEKKFSAPVKCIFGQSGLTMLQYLSIWSTVTVRCTIVQSAALRLHVCLSVCNVSGSNQEVGNLGN